MFLSGCNSILFHHWVTVLLLGYFKWCIALLLIAIIEFWVQNIRLSSEPPTPFLPLASVPLWFCLPLTGNLYSCDGCDISGISEDITWHVLEGYRNQNPRAVVWQAKRTPLARCTYLPVHDASLHHTGYWERWSLRFQFVEVMNANRTAELCSLWLCAYSSCSCVAENALHVLILLSLSWGGKRRRQKHTLVYLLGVPLFPRRPPTET